MTQNLVKTPLFLASLECHDEQIIRLLEDGLTILDENDETIRKAYENSDHPPAEINLGRYRLLTFYSKIRPGLKVIDEDGAEVLAFSFMIHLKKTTDTIPSYDAYRTYSDLGRAFLASLKDKSFIEPSSAEWKDAIKIIGQKFAPEECSKSTYVGHYPSIDMVPARTAHICHIKDSSIVSREYLPDHRPLYSIIRPNDHKIDFMIASSVTHLPESHKLQGALDNMIGAQIAGRLEGLAA